MHGGFCSVIDSLERILVDVGDAGVQVVES